MKRWLTMAGALALVLASGVEARAQMGAARGTVVDQDGAPVAGATVELLFLGEIERKYSTTTKDDGGYTKMVPTGRYRVIASKEGYQGTYLDEAVRTGDPTDLPTLKIVDMEAAARAAAAPIVKRFEEAAGLMKAGKLDEAEAIYVDLREEHPKIPDSHFNLGMIYAQQGKWPEAEAAFAKTIEIEPENVDAGVLLADVYKNQGRLDEALASMEALATEHPDNAEIHHNLGVFYLNANRYDDAFASLEESLRLDPDNPDVLYLLGTVSVTRGKADQAVSFLQSYLDKAPPDSPNRDTATELISSMRPE